MEEKDDDGSAGLERPSLAPSSASTAACLASLEAASFHCRFDSSSAASLSTPSEPAELDESTVWSWLVKDSTPEPLARSMSEGAPSSSVAERITASSPAARLAERLAASWPAGSGGIPTAALPSGMAYTSMCSGTPSLAHWSTTWW